MDLTSFQELRFVFSSKKNLSSVWHINKCGSICTVHISSRVTFWKPANKWNELTFVCQYVVLWMEMDGHMPVAGSFVPLMF